MSLTEREKRVFESLGSVEAIPHGYDYRWVFRCSHEPVTKEVRSMEKKGVITIVIFGLAGASLSINYDSPHLEKEDVPQ